MEFIFNKAGTLFAKILDQDRCAAMNRCLADIKADRELHLDKTFNEQLRVFGRSQDFSHALGFYEIGLRVFGANAAGLKIGA